MSLSDIAYMAGIFDGEGSVTISAEAKRAKNYYLRATVTNTNEPLMKWIVEHFRGGYIAKTRGILTRKDCYTWTISGKKAQNFLRIIQDFSIVKKPQINVALQFVVKDCSHHCSIEEREVRAKLRLLIKELNK